MAQNYINKIKIDNTEHLIEPTLYVAPTLSSSAYSATLNNFTLVTGVTIQAKFATTNPANATLNINETGAKNIFYNNAKITASQFKINHVYTLTYDGTQWQVVGDIDTNTQSNYGNITTAGKIGTTADLAVYTTTGGLVMAGSLKTDAPSASGNDTSFITSISQDSKGKISASKATIPAASTSVAGITTVGASGGAAAYSHTHDYLPVSYTAPDFSVATTTNGAYPLTGGNNPVTGAAEYGGVLQFGASASSTNYYAAQLVVSAASGATSPVHAYIRRMTSTPAWSDWTTLLDNKNTTAPSTVPTLSWNTESTVFTLNGTAVKVKAMAKPTYAFTDLTSHPTTLSGYGITNAVQYNGIDNDIGSSATATNAKAYWANNNKVPKGKVVFNYNSSGTEYTTLFSNNNNSYGSILRWGYSDNYIRILRAHPNQTTYNGWYTEDWEKISAGYADSAGKATNDADGHAINTTYAKLASPALTGTPTAPTAADGTNTTQIATTEFVNNTLAYANAMTFKGTLGTGGTITALPASHNAGDTYRVITAGTWAGKYCEVGTLIICVKDGTAAANADWTSVETNEDGAVIGPTSSTANQIPKFSSNTGRVITNSEVKIDDNNNIITTGSYIETAAGRFQQIDLLPGGSWSNYTNDAWYRCCKITPKYGGYANFIIQFGGTWSTGVPTIATVSIQTLSTTITLLHCSRAGFIKAIRLVNNNGMWLDVQLSTESSRSMGKPSATFIGNVVISDISTAATITTDTTAPAATLIFRTTTDQPTFTLQDNDGTNSTTSTFTHADQILKLPSTIKASITGNATSASKLSNTSAIGSDVKPVYFTNGGVPQATATEMVRAFKTADVGTDMNAYYDSGMYSIPGGTLSNYPTGGSKFATFITVAYRKPSGNTKPDYAWQMGNFTQNSDRLWYRTSQADSWRAWRQIVNIATNTAAGDSGTPVYVTADGEVKACTAYASASVSYATSAGKATNDSDGKAINTTYLKLAGGALTGAVTNSSTIISASCSGVYNTNGDSFIGFYKGNTNVTANRLGMIFMNTKTVDSTKVPVRFYFRQYSYNTSTGAPVEYWDQYALPEATAGKSNATTYNILTDKDLSFNITGTAANVTGTVAIAHGGTGLTSADPHKVLIGPSTGTAAAAPTWRAIVAADLPAASTSAAGIIQIGTAATNAMAGNTTVTNVAISANTTTNANYPVVFATTNKDTTTAKTEGLQKSGAKFYFNPSTGILTATGFAGALTGNVTGNVTGSSGSCTGNAATASKISAKLAATTKTYLLGTSTAITATAANVEMTGDTGVYLTTTAGQLNATTYLVNEKVRMEYNSTDQSLDFIFV